jgi:SSS family transporter
MFGLRIVDLVTLAIYLLGITALGMWMGKTVKDTADYFVGGRRFGKVMGIFSVFGAGTHSDQAVSVVAKTYTSGMSGIWYQWLYLFVTPFNWWITPILRRCRAITTGDYFEARYSRGVATLYVLVGIAHMMVAIGVMLKGSGAVIRAVTGGELSEGWAIAAMTLMFVVYGVVGGLAAAVVTDFVQGLLTIVFSFILLPFAIHDIGGFTGLHEGVARAANTAHGPHASVSAQDLWSLVAPGEIGVFYITVIVINAMVGIVTQPHVMPISGAVKTERESQIGSVYGSMIKRVCTVAWTFLGMYAIAKYPGLVDQSNIDECFGRIAHELLPQMMPGLIGVFIAALLASIMSSCDAFMITCSGLFTQNIYRPFIAPRRSQSHYVGVGRVAAVLTVAGGVAIAYKLDNVIQGLELLWMVPALMGVTFWAGLFWRKATTAGAWAGTLLAFGALLFTSDTGLWSFTREVANSRVSSMPAHFDVEFDDARGSVSRTLRQEFARHGITLSDSATLAIDETDRATGRSTRWLISDGERCYTVIREKGTETLELYANVLPAGMLWRGRLLLPWQMIIYLVAGALGLVVASLLTRPPDRRRLDRFYGTLRTPVQPAEVIEAPLTLPRGVEPAPERKLVDHPDWEIQRPTLRGIVGFLIAWVLVVLLILAVLVLVRIGA